MSSALTLLPLLLLLQQAELTSAVINYPFGFYNLSIPGLLDTGFVEVFACTVGTSVVRLNMTLQQRIHSTCTEVAQDVSFRRTLDHTVVNGEKVNGDSHMVPLGVSMTSVSEINVFVSASARILPEGTMVLPLTTGSTEFFVAGWIGISTFAADSGLILAPGYADTVAEVYRVAAGVYTRLHSINFTDDLSIAQVSFNLTDTTGLYVNSTKPMNVFSHVICGQVPVATRFCDAMMEHIPPVSELGTTHVVPPIGGISTAAGYIVRVVPTTSSGNTTITWSNITAVVPPAGSSSKSAGEYQELDVSRTDKPLLVTCSSSCLVMQYNKGEEADVTSDVITDPFMMVTASTANFASSSCFSTSLALSASEQKKKLLNYISVVTATSQTSSIELDGSVIAAVWTAIDSYSVTTLPVSHGWHSLTAVAGSGATFAAYVYGHSNETTAYAYGYSVVHKVLGTLSDGPAKGNCIRVSDTPIDSVRPSYGPAAGGTSVTIRGQGLTASSVTAVYFGPHKGIVDRDRVEKNVVMVLTPSVDETTGPLLLRLELTDGSWIESDRAFQYRPNPVLADIEPRDHLTVGGTEVTVLGGHLNSVAQPRITVSAVVTRTINQSSTESQNDTDTESCDSTQANADGRTMLCRMPKLNLPDDLEEQLESSESGRISAMAGPGVAAYQSKDGRTRADIYIGLKLDGYKRYENISAVDPDITFQFSIQPTISCGSDDIEFVPNTQNVISIEGDRMTRGSRLVDYRVTIGDSECVPVSLTDNRLDCAPPKTKPNKHINDTFCHGDTLSMQISVGNAKYQCSCVRYLPEDNLPLIVGVVVGPAVLLAVVITATWMCRRRKQRKQRRKTQSGRPEGDETSTNNVARSHRTSWHGLPRVRLSHVY